MFGPNGLASSFLFISLAENSALSIQVKPELEASLSSLFDIGIKTKDLIYSLKPSSSLSIGMPSPDSLSIHDSIQEFSF